MKVIIFGDRSSWGSFYPTQSNIDVIGLSYITHKKDGGILFEVIDKQMFFLAVIEHGIRLIKIIE